MSQINVLITGVGGPVGHSILKSVQLANLPCRTIATDRGFRSIGLTEADTYYIIPSANDPNYLERLAEVCLTEKVDAVFVGSEPELHFLGQNIARFEAASQTKLIVSSPDVLAITEDKWKTVHFLAENGFDYPHSAIPEQPEQLETLIEEIGFPLLVKPRFGSGSVGVHRVNNQEELAHVLALLVQPVVQEYLEPDDQEYTTAVFVDQYQQAQGSIIMRRELAAGITYHAEVIHNEAIDGTIQEIAQRLRPLGPCNIQLRLTERGPVTFEINARFSSSVVMRANFGYNEAEMTLRSFIFNQKIQPSQPIVGEVQRYWAEKYTFSTANTRIQSLSKSQ